MYPYNVQKGFLPSLVLFEKIERLPTSLNVQISLKYLECVFLDQVECVGCVM